MNTPAANRKMVREARQTPTRIMGVPNSTSNHGNDGGMHDQCVDPFWVDLWPCDKDHGHDLIYTDAGGKLRCRTCESERRRRNRQENVERERHANHDRKARKRRAEGRTYPAYRPGSGKRGTGEYV